jgi:hypothetical protein
MVRRIPRQGKRHLLQYPCRIQPFRKHSARLLSVPKLRSSCPPNLWLNYATSLLRHYHETYSTFQVTGRISWPAPWRCVWGKVAYGKTQRDGSYRWNPLPNTPSRRSAFMGERRTRDSSVGLGTRYGLDDRDVGVRVPVRSRIFFSPQRTASLWSTPRLLPNGYRWRFSRE